MMVADRIGASTRDGRDLAAVERPRLYHQRCISIGVYLNHTQLARSLPAGGQAHLAMLSVMTNDLASGC
jgi:hypothetical protein